MSEPSTPKSTDNTSSTVGLTEKPTNTAFSLKATTSRTYTGADASTLEQRNAMGLGVKVDPKDDHNSSLEVNYTLTDNQQPSKNDPWTYGDERTASVQSNTSGTNYNLALNTKKAPSLTKKMIVFQMKQTLA